MNKKFLLLIPIILICSCGNNVTSYSEEISIIESKSSYSSEEIISSFFSIEIESESLSSSFEISSEEEKILNPMNEPMIHQQYYLNHIGDIYNSWNSYKGKGITIAVIDVGFNPYHEDLTFSDGTSKVSEKSASFTTKKNTSTNKYETSRTDGIASVINMGESHGTFCAGVAAGGLNGKGIIGIAPEASLLLLKTDAKPLSIAAAFKYAADNDAKVISISIGSYYDYDGDLNSDGSDLNEVFNESVAYCRNKGTVVISAGGNGGLDGRQVEWTYPGATTGVIGVGGLKANSSSELWEGSSYNYDKNSQFCDVFAPANLMYGICHYDDKGKHYDYDAGWNGTSFAAPIVAGMAALYFEKNPSNTPLQFENDLYNSCVKLEEQIVSEKTVKANQLGYGRVDVGKLLNTELKSSIDIKIKYSGSTLYAFAWDNTGTYALDNKYWPGKKLTKSGDYYTLNIDASKYQNIIFNGGNNTFQTVDLCTSSFMYGMFII